MAPDSLIEFVKESNAIEGCCRLDPQDPLYANHLVVAQRIFSGEILSSKQVHAILMDGVKEFKYKPGKYRVGNIHVEFGIQKISMPHPIHVDGLMGEWDHDVNKFLSRQDSGTEFDVAQAALDLQFQFLCVHPFPDGNGRVARLLWNMLRIQKGLPWEIVFAKNRMDYYLGIRKYDQNVFRVRYPDVY